MHNDIRLDDTDDIKINAGDFDVGDSVLQEVDIIVRLNRGQLKSDLLLGPSFVSMINTPANSSKVKTVLKLHLARDRKSLEELKDLIHIKTK